MPVRVTTPVAATTVTPLPPPTAKGAPRPIADIEQAFGWAAGSWQDQLIQAADAASKPPDGKTSRAEIDTYLKTTTDLKFLTSTTLGNMAVNLGPDQKKVDTFHYTEKWLAKASDANHDGTLTATEFGAYVQAARTDRLHLWVPDERAASFESAIASQTGEKDALNQVGIKGTSMNKEYMHIQQDETRHDPAIVSYVLTAQDIRLGTNPQRQDNFHGDTDTKGTAMPSDYAHSGYDQGHQKPAEDAPNDPAMSESFLMTNMAPQTPELNRMSWRVIEAGVRQLVEATGAKATINTGSLFCDASGKPLPADQVQTIGVNKVAVPTYSFKTVLLEYPDGHKQMMAFMMPNRHDLPVKGDDGMRKLIHGAMIPVSQLENIIAAQQGTKPGSVQLYPQLVGAAGKALRNAPPPATLTIPNPEKYSYANFIWPQAVPVTPGLRAMGVAPLPTLDLGTVEHPK
jgi:endonuclease G